VGFDHVSCGGMRVSHQLANVKFTDRDYIDTLFNGLVKVANSIETAFLWIHTFTLKMV
jgi:hypothetical protein